MDTTTVAHPRTPDTRELRALELHRTRGHEIVRLAPNIYMVPSCTGSGAYRVDYSLETCDCPDHARRRENCKHILAVGVHVAKRRRPRPCICYAGLVYIGRLELTEEGEEVEVIEPVPCRRCSR